MFFVLLHYNDIFDFSVNEELKFDYEENNNLEIDKNFN